MLSRVIVQDAIVTHLRHHKKSRRKKYNARVQNPPLLLRPILALPCWKRPQSDFLAACNNSQKGVGPNEREIQAIASKQRGQSHRRRAPLVRPLVSIRQAIWLN
jgi:hypothetical protein